MDIYFTKEYGALCEKMEQGESVCLNYSCDYGSIRYVFIKRQIPKTVNGEVFYDLITPYGYGGPIIEETTDKEKLLSCFGESMKDYYKQNNIVSEFVRFHPLKQNALDFKEIYNVECIRHTLATVISDEEDPIQTRFTKGCRKKIRQVLNRGVCYEIVTSPEDLSEFKDIYYSTMDRNEAGDFYYFDDEYFLNCISKFKSNLLLIKALFEGKTIAAMLCFVSDGTVHIHLSGTLTEYLYLSPAYILRYAVTLWAKENWYKTIHHGGGRSNASDDPLFTFKKQFSTDGELDFYIAKKICNSKIYSQLCAELENNENSEFFPAYRKR